MKAANIIVLILIVLGALNWGLLGFFGFNLVTTIFNENMLMSRLVYAVIGLSGLWSVSFFSKCKCLCNSCHNKNELK